MYTIYIHITLLLLSMHDIFDSLYTTIKSNRTQCLYKVYVYIYIYTYIYIYIHISQKSATYSILFAACGGELSEDNLNQIKLPTILFAVVLYKLVPEHSDILLFNYVLPWSSWTCQGCVMQIHCNPYSNFLLSFGIKSAQFLHKPLSLSELSIVHILRNT